MQIYPTVYAAFLASAEKYPGNFCIDTGKAKLTYREVELRVRRLAGYLRGTAHLKSGKAVIVLCDNDPHWLIVSLAVQACGAIEFPVRLGTSSAELKELRRRTGCRHIFVATDRAARTVQRALQGCTVIVFEQGKQNRTHFGELAAIVAEENPIRAFHAEAAQVAAVIETSGTTGRAKQVPVLHASFLHSMRVIPRMLRLGPRDVFLSCLPSWHLYARLVEYTALACGGRIVYAAIPDLEQRLKTSGCTIFPSFPEIWEKIHHGILDSLGQMRFGRWLQKLIDLSVTTNSILENAASRSRFSGSKPGPFAWLRLSYLLPLRTLLMATVFRAIRRRVSPTLRYAIMGDAPLPRSVDETLRAIGFEVLEGYGSTEQCVTALRRPGRHFPGVIGRILPGVQVITHDTLTSEWNGLPLGEIAVSGENVFRGYFTTMRGLMQIPAQPSTYLTGDIGFVDSARNLIVVGRRVNAFQLRNGEYIFPELVENVLRGCRFVGRVVVLGKGQTRPVALVVPDFPALLHWLEPHGGYPTVLAEKPESDAAFWKRVLQSPAVRQLYASEFHALQQESGLPQYARVSAFALIAHNFHRGRELTPTLKIRRAQVEKLYARELRKLRGD